jgi:hypothetical protein
MTAQERVAAAMMTALAHPIPVNMRMFAKNFGAESPILRNEDLWESDRDAIRANVAKETEKTGQPSGVISYDGYGKESTRVEEPSETLGTILYDSMTNPTYRMETTLGKAQYKSLPKGYTEISDTYDFGEPGSARKYIEALGVGRASFDTYRAMGPLGPLHMIGDLIRPQGTGKPFTMIIPPKVGMDIHPREIAQTEPTDIPLEMRMAQRPEGPSRRTYPEKVAEIRGVPLSQEGIGYAILEREQLAAKEQAAQERELYKQRHQYGIR